MIQVDSVRAWLARYKSLPKEELPEFADLIIGQEDLIKDVFYVLNDPRHHEFDPVHHQLYDLCRSGNKKLRLFCLQYIPTLIYNYLKEHSRLKGFDPEIFAKLESFLLALYNLAFAQNVIKYFPPEGVPREKFYPLNYPSIYHDPQHYSMNSLMEHSHLFVDPSSSTGGPVISYDEGADLEPITTVNSENRLKLVTALLYIHNQFLAEIPKCALRLTCMIVVNLCLSSFGDHLASYSIPASYNSSKFPLGGRNRFRDSVARFGHVTENRIPSDERLYREFLQTIYYCIFNGTSEEAFEALEAIHMRSTYQLYPEVLMSIGAIKNTVNKASMKGPQPDTMGIWLSSVQPSSIAAISKSAITNASFKLRKLPEDITPIITASSNLKTVREEEGASPPGHVTATANLGADKKQMSKAAIAANRLKEALLHPSSNTASFTTKNAQPTTEQLIPMMTLTTENPEISIAQQDGAHGTEHALGTILSVGTTGHHGHAHTATPFSFLPIGAAKFWAKAFAPPPLQPSTAEEGESNGENVEQSTAAARLLTPPSHVIQESASAPPIPTSKDRIKLKLDKVKARLKEFQQHLEDSPPLDKSLEVHEESRNHGTSAEIFVPSEEKGAADHLTKIPTTKGKKYAATVSVPLKASSDTRVGARRKGSTGPAPSDDNGGIDGDESNQLMTPTPRGLTTYDNYPNLKPSLPPMSPRTSLIPPKDYPTSTSKIGNGRKPDNDTTGAAMVKKNEGAIVSVDKYKPLVKFSKGENSLGDGKKGSSATSLGLGKNRRHHKGFKEELAALKLGLKKSHAIPLPPLVPSITTFPPTASVAPHKPPLHSALKSARKMRDEPEELFQDDQPIGVPTIRPIISDDDDDEEGTIGGHEGPADESAVRSRVPPRPGGTDSSASNNNGPDAVPSRKEHRKKPAPTTEKIKSFFDNALSTDREHRKNSTERGKDHATLHHAPSVDLVASASQPVGGIKKRRKTLASKKKMLSEFLSSLHHSSSESLSSDERTKTSKPHPSNKTGPKMAAAFRTESLTASSSPDLVTMVDDDGPQQALADPATSAVVGQDEEGSYISERFNKLQQLQKYQERAFKTAAPKPKLKKYNKKKKSLPYLEPTTALLLDDADERGGERRLSVPTSGAESEPKSAVQDSEERIQQLAGKIKKFLTVSSTSSSPGPSHKRGGFGADKPRSDTSDNTPYRENTKI